MIEKTKEEILERCKNCWRVAKCYTKHLIEQHEVDYCAGYLPLSAGAIEGGENEQA